MLFVFDKVEPHNHQRTVFPRGDKSKKLKGVLATRSCFRPNGIGMSHVYIKKIEGNVLTVTGLDALCDTPVIDIKPALHVEDMDKAKDLELMFL